MIPVPGWTLALFKRDQREKYLKERRKEQHKKAVAKRRKAKRGGKR
jgi:hypothetical protein